MTKCTHCDQQLMTLDEFIRFGTDALADHTREFKEFLSAMDDKEAASYVTDSIHESARWADLITWLVGRDRVGLESLERVVTDIRRKLGVALQASDTKH